ncbi:5'-methylthioadenosine/S-adenosylhomocysteine nucleosidase [Amycolatopsis coloradensis]|nr:5'-methylthioadenosine/S-adenosylhomocysteine nucleosidase [Amycolatopsis coloradensis]
MLVILTALDLEGAAIRKHLTNLRTHHHGAGTVFEVGALASRPSCEIALAVIGMGTVNAAAITERAITEFRPSAVLFVGIAGGLREWIALGDVVVATRVYAYQGGRVDGDEFLARPQAWDTSHRLVQLAKHVNRAQAWPGASETRAAVHFEPVAAGEIVLNSTSAPERDRLRSHYNDAAAVEMESSGVALAGHLHEATPTIAIRGISDLADGNKHRVDSSGWQDTAVHNAAAFAVGLAQAIDQTLGRPTNPEEGHTPTPNQPVPGTPGGRTTSVSKGNAVGDIASTGPVTVDQKVTTYARRHPLLVTLMAILLVAVLALAGWGTYLVLGQPAASTTISSSPLPPTPDRSTPEATAKSFVDALTARDRQLAESMVCVEQRDWFARRYKVVEKYSPGNVAVGDVSLAAVTLSVVVVKVVPAQRPRENGATYDARMAWVHGNIPETLDPEVKRKLSKPDDWGTGLRLEPTGSWSVC